MRKLAMLFPIIGLLGACSNMSEYERQVQDYEPVYCYKSLGAVQCYDVPNHRDEKRLVNYFGPAPERYDRPQPAEIFTDYQAPEPVGYWVKNPEPIPRAAVVQPNDELSWRHETSSSQGSVPAPDVVQSFPRSQAGRVVDLEAE